MTYNVALVGDDRDRQVVTGSDSVAIGDELDVQGIRCEVIAHLWRVGEPETRSADAWAEVALAASALTEVPYGDRTFGLETPRRLARR